MLPLLRCSALLFVPLLLYCCSIVTCVYCTFVRYVVALPRCSLFLLHVDCYVTLLLLFVTRLRVVERLLLLFYRVVVICCYVYARYEPRLHLLPRYVTLRLTVVYCLLLRLLLIALFCVFVCVVPFVLELRSFR